MKQDKAKNILSDYRDAFRQYIHSFSHGSRAKQRIALQEQMGQISMLVDDYYGPYKLKIDDDNVCDFHRSLSIALTEEIFNNVYCDFITGNILLALNSAIGNINYNTVPSKKITPVLQINDEQLKKRCLDLLDAPDLFDRVIREATIIFEHRLRGMISHEKLCELIPKAVEQTGEPLATNLLSPNKPIVVVSTDKKEQTAFMKMTIGVFAYLRNPFHHSLDDQTKWSLAWSVVGLIDTLLTELDNSYVPEEYIE